LTDSPGSDSPAGPIPTEHRSIEERRLDFWIGDWELDSRSRVAPDSDEWTLGKASNRVRHVLDRGAVLEEFDARPSEDFRGMSLSIFDRTEGGWRQAWVDTAGHYMDFRGRWTGDRMIFSRECVKDSLPVLQRMVFHDITTDRFVWDWESSSDDGRTWLLLWRLVYHRRST